MAERLVLRDNVLDDIERDIATGSFEDLSRDEALDLIHSLRAARQERDAARAALREAITLVEIMALVGLLDAASKGQRAEQIDRWRRALGEG